MIRLYIDGHEADIDSRTDISVSLSISSMSTTEWGRAGYSKSLVIPNTPHNAALMGDCGSPHTAKLFNSARHQARVEAGGSVIIEGVMMLTATRLGPEGFFRFNIIGEAVQWARSATASLRSLDTGYSETLTQSAVLDSWTRPAALVRYLPVERGRSVEGDQSLYGRRVAQDDYHPMLHLRSLMEAIFASAGYSICSNFLGSEFFSSLYMSGRWREQAMERDVEEMDFRATRTTDSGTITADLFGRVYADHLANYHTVGNLVDTTSVEGCFNNGTAFGVDHTGRIRFAPSRTTRVAFEYHLRYRTDTKVLSRTRLQGFDIVRPAFLNSIYVPLENRYVDRRSEPFANGRDYKLAIFSMRPDVTYQLVATLNGQDVVLLAEVAENFTTINYSGDGVLSDLELYVDEGNIVRQATEDWALYDGYATERGSREVEVTVRSAPHEVLPAEPQYFDMFYFGGAEEGMTMELFAGTGMRPLFVPYPAEGEQVEWADVADYDCSQLDVLTAVRELFDLQIYTDTSTHRVYMEPRGEFCNPEVVVDWRERIDLGRPMVVEELAGQGKATLQVAYRPTDKAAAALSQGEQGVWGEWSAGLEGYFAAEGVERRENPLFAPSVSVVGSVKSAPSVSLIAVGDVEGPDDGTILHANFDAKVLFFRSMQTLQEGEMWSWPTEHSGEVPLVEFFSPKADEPLSLLMENREGVEGLGRYWAPRVEALNHARRITLNVRLWPDEVEAIAFPNSQGRDFRALYLLRLEGEDVLCRLEEVVDYNPMAPSTKCVLVSLA